MMQPISHLDTLDTQEIEQIFAPAYLPDFSYQISAHSLWQFYQLQLAQSPLTQLQIAQQLWQRVAEVLQVIKADFQAIADRDPAAHHWLEILCCYPGLHALVIHRFAHWLHHRQIPLLPRLIAYCARFITGIDIHPAATIGKGVFIDHGMGVVIGETAIIGDYVLLYQGVTLGGTGKETGKRHPTMRSSVQELKFSAIFKLVIMLALGQAQSYCVMSQPTPRLWVYLPAFVVLVSPPR
jgi:serine O-acetyltransferase